MPETDLLAGYLDQERGQPFVWGKGNGDCLLFVAGWGVLLNGIDFAAHLRGTYIDEQGARDAIGQEGGAVAFFERVAGNRRKDNEQERGDIGLLAFNGWHFGMICTGSMWVLRAAPQGVRYMRRTPDFVWAPNPARP